jgi:cytoskeletal protein CcmA (bactofilin family)
VVCPRCGHLQAEPRTAYSTLCKNCGQHVRLDEILSPAPRTSRRVPQQRRITRFECGAVLQVPVSAESTMCKWCSCYVDLHPYRVTSAAAINFKTKGKVTIETRGSAFNTESIAGDAVIKGNFHGKQTVENSLTFFSTADIKGSMSAAHLEIPVENRFYWPGLIEVRSAEIAGEFEDKLRAEGAVILSATARLFGDLEAETWQLRLARSSWAGCGSDWTRRAGSPGLLTRVDRFESRPAVCRPVPVMPNRSFHTGWSTVNRHQGLATQADPPCLSRGLIFPSCLRVASRAPTVAAEGPACVSTPGWTAELPVAQAPAAVGLE